GTALESRCAGAARAHDLSLEAQGRAARTTRLGLEGLARALCERPGPPKDNEARLESVVVGEVTREARQLCIPQRLIVTFSIERKITLSTTSPIKITRNVRAHNTETH